MEDMNLTEMLDGVEINEPGSGPMPQGDYLVKIMGVEVKTSKTGGRYVKVEYAVASGEFEGRKLYANYNLKCNVNSDKVISLMADGLSKEEAEAKATESAEAGTRIGRIEIKKLTTAAGFIDPKDAEKDPSLAKLVNDGLAVSWPADFSLDMIEGKTVMCRTKAETRGDKTYQTPKSVWFADPAKIGDTGESAPF